MEGFEVWPQIAKAADTIVDKALLARSKLLVGADNKPYRPNLVDGLFAVAKSLDHVATAITKMAKEIKCKK